MQSISTLFLLGRNRAASLCKVFSLEKGEMKQMASVKYEQAYFLLPMINSNFPPLPSHVTVRATLALRFSPSATVFLFLKVVLMKYPAVRGFQAVTYSFATLLHRRY